MTSALLEQTVTRRMAYSGVAAAVFAILPIAFVVLVKPSSDSAFSIFAGALLFPGERLSYYLFHIQVHDGVLFLASAIVLNWILFTSVIAAVWSICLSFLGKKIGIPSGGPV